MKKILLISGSLREKSFNTALLRAFENEFQDKAEVVWADMHLPLFNEDGEKDFPADAETLKQQIVSADAVIVSTPEYNRGMSGVLKNAIDWTSRPYGKNAWTGKKVLVTSSSISGIAGALALYQVKQSLLHLNAQIIGQPEFMVGAAAEKFDETGALTDESTKKHVASAVQMLLQD